MGNKPSVTLSVYEIRLRKMHQKDEYYPLDDFCNGNDFLKFLQYIVANWAYEPDEEKTIVVDENKQKMVRLVPNTLKPTGRVLCSLVETGDYGVISDIIDVKTGALKYTKTKDDADVLPFFMMFYVPKNMTSAIMISQRFKQFGATSIVLDTIKNEFRDRFPHTFMEISSLKSPFLSDKFMTGGKLKKISFRCFDSRVLSTLPAMQNLNPDNYTLEYSIVSRRGKSIPNNILNIFRNNTDGSKRISDLIKIPYYDYNEVAFEMNLNGHNRTLKATDIESLGSFFDITEDVESDDKGLPTYNSVRRIALSILEDIKNL